MLGGLVVFGLAANGLSLLQSLVALGFGAGVLLIAWLWQLTLRRAETAPPLSRRQQAWNATVFVVWLAVMTALAWWYLADRAEHTQPLLPAASPSGPPVDLPADPDPPEQPPPAAGITAAASRHATTPTWSRDRAVTAAVIVRPRHRFPCCFGGTVTVAVPSAPLHCHLSAAFGSPRIAVDVTVAAANR
jgi:hypothetical protein